MNKGQRLNPTPADEPKFLELVNENRDRILRICRVYAWNAADQDDLYQEILCQIWRSLPTLKATRTANTWLYRVAINTSISFVRKRASRLDRVVHFEHAELTRTIESQQAADARPDDRIAGLYQAIYQLNTVEKALVTLFLEDCTYEQIGEAMGLETSHVGVMLHRARKKLSRLMTEEVTS